MLINFKNTIKYKKEIIDSLKDIQIKRTRLYMLLTSVLVLVWIPFDLLLESKYYLEFIILRFLYSPLIIGLLLLPKHIFEKYFLQIGLFNYFYLILDIGIMVFLAERFLLYLLGFSTIFWASSVVMLQSARYIIIPGVSFIVLCIGLYPFLINKGVSQYELITGFFYFFTALSVCSVNAYLNLRVTYQLYEEKYKLDQALKKLKSAQDHLVESEKMASLGSMVAGVAHELSTPLGTILRASSAFPLILNSIEKVSKPTDEAKYIDSLSDLKKNINIVKFSCERSSELIKSFKQVAVDLSFYDPRNINLTEFFNDILNSMLHKLKDFEVDTEIQENINFNSYPGALNQIVTNLINNTLLHGYSDTKNKKRISIKSFVTNDSFVLNYTDYGQGISLENQKKIFEPFFTTKRNKGGTGLGLNIVYNIVNQKLKGRIFCKSQLNKFTTFMIELPLE